RSEPDCGSVIATAVVYSPVISGRSQVSTCAGVPNSSSGLGTNTPDTAPRAASDRITPPRSSALTTLAPRPRPPPPASRPAAVLRADQRADVAALAQLRHQVVAAAPGVDLVAQLLEPLPRERPDLRAQRALLGRLETVEPGVRLVRPRVGHPVCHPANTTET